MERMLTVEPGFQYSVNIAYDLNRNEKLKNFVPTPSSLKLLEEILLSTDKDSTDRARILIGAYGKGKSHIVLTILSVLLRKDISLFTKLNRALVDNEKLALCVQNYYESGKKLLPVVISGSSTSISQAFLLALERTLAEQNLADIMPETNYKAAEGVISRWEKDFPDTFDRFTKLISKPIKIFRKDLLDFDAATYEEFERIYPSLTAGSTFNPFLGFDIVELYESVVKTLKSRGYNGIYVVYDEFSKYLETNITKATVSDTKMLQDFAEKCCRSGNEQLHLLLISHKDIANYIDKLPKQKVDGWRGVSERFKHIYLNNNFARTYEIIGNVILKEKDQWAAFYQNNKEQFNMLYDKYKQHPMFAEDKETFEKTIVECYPLHPATIYILPRLSELVAQNERTLFSFLSANEENTLKRFLEQADEVKFTLVTPDLLFDYFEQQIRKEIYAEDIHSVYVLTKRVLEKLEVGTLESKIVKTISLIYILAQFEKLAPTREEIVNVYYNAYAAETVNEAIDNLITQEYVVYLKRSNNYLCLKQTSGVDIKKEIENAVAQQAGTVSVKQVLDRINYNRFMYPSRYNDEREITRYFSFKFIDEVEITKDVNWSKKTETDVSDGIIYGVLIHDKDVIGKLRNTLLSSSKSSGRMIFVLPKSSVNITDAVREYNAVEKLKELAGDDKVLQDEYEVIYEDLRDVIADFISTYTQPEKLRATYIHDGNEIPVERKASLSNLMSDICNTYFPNTPTINNEAINKNNPSGMAVNSRSKIVTGILRNELEKNLGLTGSGQDVSIMRGTLLRPGILCQDEEAVKINLQPADDKLKSMLGLITDFVLLAKQNGQVSFADLYLQLTHPDFGYGLRKGVIPIYLAAVLHEFKREIVITDSHGQVNLNADTLAQINAKPEDFSLAYLNWTPEKEKFVQDLTNLFSKQVNEAEKAINSYDYVVQAMKRWYFDLPKYTKEARKTVSGDKIERSYLQFIKLLKQDESSHVLLFEQIPKTLTTDGLINNDLIQKVKCTKEFYDAFLMKLSGELVNKVKVVFSTTKNKKQLSSLSLSSVVKDWCEMLDQNVFDQLFGNGTEKCLSLFKNITHNEDAEIKKLVRLATDLRLEDWDDDTILLFEKQLELYKKTAEEFVMKSGSDGESNTVSTQYQINFLDDEGLSVTKRFEKVEISQRGKLLYNNITADIEAMGAAISEQEKRQILMVILKKMC